MNDNHYEAVVNSENSDDLICIVCGEDHCDVNTGLCGSCLDDVMKDNP